MYWPTGIYCLSVCNSGQIRKFGLFWNKNIFCPSVCRVTMMQVMGASDYVDRDATRSKFNNTIFSIQVTWLYLHQPQLNESF